MSAVFDLYGIRHETIEAAREAVERALGVTLVPHESSYLGEYYRAGGAAGEELVLQPNFHEGEREFLEPEHRDSPFLLYVNHARTPEETRAKLEREPGVARLRHRER
ncbi:MAG TPA: hypothetical protein VM266_02795 [Solirubrobacteraceae bacterium]|nr:hypothetical protein [Solirubrobacteraceae bacterium]